MIEKGFNKIPDEEYFADKQYISRRDIIDLAYNPNIYFYGGDVKSGKQFEIGSIFDYISNKTPGEVSQIIKIKEKRGEKSDVEGVFLLTESDYETIMGMYEVWNNHGIVNLLQQMDSQIVICDGENKGKPDYISKDKKTIIDVKTIDSIDNVRKNIENYKYYFQKWWYIYIMQNLGFSVGSFQFYFIEKAKPHRIKIVDLSPLYDAKSEAIYERAVINQSDIDLQMNLVTYQEISPSEWMGV